MTVTTLCVPGQGLDTLSGPTSSWPGAICEVLIPRTEGVNAVVRAIDILRALGESPTGLTLVQIAEDSGLPRSTVHRIVQSLLDANFIATDRYNGGLRLGPELARLASVSGVRLVPIVRPYLLSLSKEVDEGASLAILEGDSVRFLDQAIAGPGIRAFSLVGATMPSHSTANGKVLLAAMNGKAKQVLPTLLPRLTPNTIVERAAFLAELDSVRSTGIAFDLEENEVGVCAVGRVVEDAVGNLAAITIAVPAARFYGRQAELADALTRTVAKVNEALRLSAP